MTMCIFDRPAKLRLAPREMIPGRYVKRTVDFAKINKENETLRLNIRLGNYEPCKCSACNPDTSNSGDDISTTGS